MELAQGDSSPVCKRSGGALLEQAVSAQQARPYHERLEFHQIEAEVAVLIRQLFFKPGGIDDVSSNVPN